MSILSWYILLVPCNRWSLIMSVICHEDQSSSGLVWIFKLLPSKHTVTSKWHVCHLLGHFNRLSVWSLRMINFKIYGCFKPWKSVSKSLSVTG